MLNSCLWSPKQWTKLEDKKFYFQKFKYNHKAQHEQNAMSFMKNFPIKEISLKLENKYGIKIDYSEFNKFTKKDDASKIKIGRFIHKESFTWNSKLKEMNRVEFYYSVIYDDEMNSANRIYKVLLRNNKHVRAIISGDVEHRGQIYDDLMDKLSN